MASPAAKKVPVYSTAPQAGGFIVKADNALLKTPKGADLLLPTQSLADSIAAEWKAQGEKINPAKMPLTQLAATTIDIVGKDRAHVVDQLLKFIGSELVCHYADEPETLVKRQHATWQPLLDWCALKFGATFNTGSGIMPIIQSPETIDVLRRLIEAYDDFCLIGLRHTADICGSLVLALALMEKRMTPEQVLAAAELDALFQMEKWGEDADIIKRHVDALNELKTCEKWCGLVD